LIKVVGALTSFRVNEEDEITGLDLSAHGERAYDITS
jgi:Amt family ammonium transporter